MVHRGRLPQLGEIENVNGRLVRSGGKKAQICGTDLVCLCCQESFSPSGFIVHSDVNAKHRKPYQAIIVLEDDGETESNTLDYFRFASATNELTEIELKEWRRLQIFSTPTEDGLSNWIGKKVQIYRDGRCAYGEIKDYSGGEGAYLVEFVWEKKTEWVKFDNNFMLVDDPQLPEGEFYVENILAKRCFKNLVEYRVKWIGYPDSDNTWEPIENLQHSKELIKEFERRSQKKRKKKIEKKDNKKIMDLQALYHQNPCSFYATPSNSQIENDKIELEHEFDHVEHVEHVEHELEHVEHESALENNSDKHEEDWYGLNLRPELEPLPKDLSQEVADQTMDIVKPILDDVLEIKKPPLLSDPKMEDFFHSMEKKGTIPIGKAKNLLTVFQKQEITYELLMQAEPSKLELLIKDLVPTKGLRLAIDTELSAKRNNI